MKCLTRNIVGVLIFAALVFSGMPVQAESPYVQRWTQQLGTIKHDYAYGVAVDSGGNAYVTGYTYGDLDGNTNAGGSDIFLIKYDTDGSKLWTQQMGTATGDSAWSVAVDSGGNVYVTGSTDGDLDGNTSAGGSDIVLIKFDTNGNKLWTQQMGSATYDYVYGVAVDSGGNAYVAGYTLGDLDGNTSAGGRDIFLIKYDTNGNRLWTQQMGTSSDDWAFDVAVDSGGNVYVTGSTDGDLDGNTSAGDRDIILIKYDANGSKLWTQQLGSAAFDYAWSVAVDSSGNVYMTGGTDSDLDGNTSAGGRDIILIKYDANGSKLWTQQVGSSSSDFARGVAVDSSGNAYVTGSTGGGLDGNTNAGGNDIFLIKFFAPCPQSPQWSLSMGTVGSDYGTGIAMDSSGNTYVTGYTSGFFEEITSPGHWDFFLLKFDADANMFWKVLYGSSSYDWAFDVAVDSGGNAYVVGTTGGGIDGNTNAGNGDLFLIKFDTDGSKLWARQLGSAAYDYAYGVAVDSSGNAYVTGFTGGDLDGNTSAGGVDIFLIKFDTNGSKLWLQQLGSSTHDYAHAVAVDSGGNAYVVGYTYGDIDGNANAGGSDIVVIKYDTNGNKLWIQQMGTSSYEWAHDVAVDSGGNAYVTGSTYGDLDGNTSAGGYDIFLIKFDTSGSKLWTQQMGSSSYEYAYGVAVNNNGKVYVSGFTYGNLDGNTNAGGSDLFFVEYDTNGTKICTVQHGTSLYENVTSLAVSNNGDIYMFGFIYDGEGFEVSLTDIYLIKFKGEEPAPLTWARSYGGPQRDTGWSILAMTDGGYLVGGGSRSSDNMNRLWLLKLNQQGDVSWQKTYEQVRYLDENVQIQETADGGFIVSHYGPHETHVLRLTSTGTVVWSRAYELDSYFEAKSMALASDGSIFLAGATPPTNPADFWADAWVMRLNASGDVTWSKRFGTPGMEYFLGVAATSDGGCVVSGFGRYGYAWIVKVDVSGNSQWQREYAAGIVDPYTFSIIQTTDGGYLATGRYEQSASSNSDAWLLRLDSSGNDIWQRRYGDSTFESASSALETASGGFVVAGAVSVPGQSYDFWLFGIDADGNLLWQQRYGGTGPEYSRQVVLADDGGFAFAGRTSSFGAGDMDIWVVKVASDGSIADPCPWRFSTGAPVTDTNAPSTTTNIVPVDLTPTVTTRTVTPVNTQGTRTDQCPAP